MEFIQARRGCKKKKKNPSPRRGRTTGPLNQNGWGDEENEGVGTGGQWHVSSTHRGGTGID